MEEEFPSPFNILDTFLTYEINLSKFFPSKRTIATFTILYNRIWLTSFGEILTYFCSHAYFSLVFVLKISTKAVLRFY